MVILTVSDLKSDVLEAYDIGVSSFTRKPSSYEGWIQYLDSLRTYWMNTVTLLPIYFRRQS